MPLSGRKNKSSYAHSIEYCTAVKSEWILATQINMGEFCELILSDRARAGDAQYYAIYTKSRNMSNSTVHH